MGLREVWQYLPHRYPFLFVDGVVDVVPGKSIHAFKNVSVNEAFFAGHFPGNPVMPGVLIIEALAQAAAILGFKTLERKPSDGLTYYLTGVENARFRRMVLPGDRLDLQVSLKAYRRMLVKLDGQAFVGDQLAASCALSCAEQTVQPVG